MTDGHGTKYPRSGSPLTRGGPRSSVLAPLDARCELGGIRAVGVRPDRRDAASVRSAGL